MRRNAWPLLLAALAIAGQACNLDRILDPSLPTSTIAVTDTPTALPSPTPALTPAPELSGEARIQAGEKALFYGDWAGALQEYQRTLNETQDDELRAAAYLGLGRTYIHMGNFTEARDVLEAALELFPGSGASAAIYIALADVYAEFNDPLAGEAAYASYLELRPGIIDSYVAEWRGDSLMRAANYADAIDAYQQAAVTPRLGDTFIVQVKVGNAQAASGDLQSALGTYQAIFDATSNDYLKADMDLLIGRTHLSLGDTENAYSHFQHAVNSYPLAGSTLAALQELVNAGVTVDEFQRGYIDYNMAVLNDSAELYAAAIRAFDRYLAAAPEEHSDAAHYYRALSLQATADYNGAIQEFDHMLAEHAFDTNWVDAFAEKAFTQWFYLDDYDAAIDALLGFVAATPSQPASAEFLFTAGQIAEEGGRLTRSTEIWPRVADEYPSSEFAYNSVFLAGISAYRLEDYPMAQGLFLRANQSALSLEQEAQSLFWLAKAYRTGGNEELAADAWEQAAAVDPTGYYSERARDILDGRIIFQAPEAFSFEYDAAAERQAAEAWIRSTFNLPGDTDLSGPGPLLADPRFQRGAELWRLGKYEQARAEFEDLRQGLTADPASSYRLANYLLDLGLYRTAIFAAREVLNFAGMSDAATLNAPRYFSLVRFGAYYPEIVLPEAAGKDIDPLFFYAMMRQESLFEGFVTSSAGARGLLQVIPITGQEIADLIDWPPGYTADDLYRPLVSITFGVRYLDIQRRAFGGDMYAALAAYNAGPGNASYWVNLAKGDPDLFLEVVGFPETRSHIRSVYELFTIYRNLYSIEE
ncbi:MAG: tetratricopeptide repeat protein [Anaerolineales bacterium]